MYNLSLPELILGQLTTVYCLSLVVSAPARQPRSDKVSFHGLSSGFELSQMILYEWRQEWARSGYLKLDTSHVHTSIKT